jgi:hypothetical protein
MPDAVVSYDPVRIQALIARAQSVSDHLAQRPCADPLADEALSVARIVQSHVEDGWLPQLAAIAASRVLLDPVDMDAPSCPIVTDAGVITAVVDHLNPTERTYFQGFVDANATNVATELWLFDARGDYATDHLPDELTTLDDANDWQWLAQLYLVEQYHRMVADGTVTLQRDGDAYWIDPLDLIDPTSTIAADIILAAVMAPGNMRPGGAISEATARTARSPMPEPRPLTTPDGRVPGPRTSPEPPRRPPHVPETWEPRPADNGHGWVWQLPGSYRDSNSARVMDFHVNGRYESGYVVFRSKVNQPLTVDGKPGSPAQTHIPRIWEDGSYPVPTGWPDAHTATAPH